MKLLSQLETESVLKYVQLTTVDKGNNPMALQSTPFKYVSQ